MQVSESVSCYVEGIPDRVSHCLSTLRSGYFPVRRSLSIVTVFFDQDVRQVKLQARSLCLFMDERGVDEIFVIGNSSHRNSLAETFRDSIFEEYGHFKSRVRYFDAHEIFLFGNGPGWMSQQIVKLGISRHIFSDYYLILDTKNHLTKPSTVSDFIAPNGRAICAYERFSGHQMEQYLRDSLSYFGVDPERFTHRSVTTVTPFCIYTSVVRSCIEAIEVKEKQALGMFLMSTRLRLSEFFLLMGFMVRYGGALESLFEFTRPPVVTIWPHTPKRESAVEDLIAQAEQNETINFFSVHRNARMQLSLDSRAAIIAFWMKARLIKDESDGLFFLDYASSF